MCRLILLLLITNNLFGQCGSDVTNQYLHNPSFEQWQNDPYDPSGYYNQCPQSLFSTMYSVDYWHQGTNEGTSDWFSSQCPQYGSFPTSMPSSLRNNIPHGNSVVGFIASDNYHEFISTCPIQPFIAGQTYSISFKIGSWGMSLNGGSCNLTLPTAEIVLYGKATCPTGTPGDWYEQPTDWQPGCLYSIVGWSVLGSTTYTRSTNWTTITINFTPSFTVRYIEIGGACNVGYDYETAQCYPYFVVDEIEVFSTSCNDNNPCTIDVCVNNQCQYTPRICNDFNPCTIDVCLN